MLWVACLVNVLCTFWEVKTCYTRCVHSASHFLCSTTVISLYSVILRGWFFKLIQKSMEYIDWESCAFQLRKITVFGKITTLAPFFLPLQVKCVVSKACCTVETCSGFRIISIFIITGWFLCSGKLKINLQKYLRGIHLSFCRFFYIWSRNCTKQSYRIHCILKKEECFEALFFILSLCRLMTKNSLCVLAFRTTCQPCQCEISFYFLDRFLFLDVLRCLRRSFCSLQLKQNCYLLLSTASVQAGK